MKTTKRCEMGIQRLVHGLVIIGLLLGAGLASASEALNLGIFPRFNPSQARTMFVPLAEHLEAELGVPVKLNISKNFESFMWELSTGKFDLVHFNQYHYIRAHKELGYEVIAHNVERGDATITGALLVRRDSGIKQVSDLKGKRIIFGGGTEAMMSYIVPKQLLKSHGLKDSDYRTIFARNPPNAVVAAYSGEADAAGSGSIVLELGVINKMLNPAEMRILVEGEPLAHLPWAVKRGMEPSLRRQIQSVLVGLSHSQTGRQLLINARLSGIIASEDKDYDPHRAIVADVLGESY